MLGPATPRTGRVLRRVGGGTVSRSLIGYPVGTARRLPPAPITASRPSRANFSERRRFVVPAVLHLRVGAGLRRYFFTPSDETSPNVDKPRGDDVTVEQLLKNSAAGETPAGELDGGAAGMVADIDDRPPARSQQQYQNQERAEQEATLNALHIPDRMTRATVRRAFAGNLLITGLKFGVWYDVGSSAMLAEAVHTLADSGNQVLLFMGLMQSSQYPSEKYPYGFGRASYFWALVSAVGMFWTGGVISLGHAAYTMSVENHAFEVTPAMLGVLGLSLLIDGYVLTKALKDIRQGQPKSNSLLQNVRSISDPLMLMVVLEDVAACAGIVIATAGIALTYFTGNIIYDAAASVGVGVLLAGVAMKIISENNRMLLGTSIPKSKEEDIRKLILQNECIDYVGQVQTQVIGPKGSFQFKADIDFNGEAIAERLLTESYLVAFKEADGNPQMLQSLLKLYTEDVTRLIEREVKAVEEDIRNKYPGAAYIELEPDSLKAYESALSEDGLKRGALRSRRRSVGEPGLP